MPQVHKQRKFDNKGESKGKTIYFGTHRGSSVYIRFYDKEKDRKIKVLKVDVDSWQRYEIVLEKAEDFIERFIEEKHLIVFI